MTNYTFIVKSSSGGTYNIECEIGEDYIAIGCSCKAGQFKTFCKHVKTLFDADLSLLSDPDKQAVHFIECHGLIKQTPLIERYHQMQSEIDKLDAYLTNIRNECNQKKATARRRFMSGE